MNCTAEQRVHDDIDVVTAHVEVALLGQLEVRGAVRPRLEPACDDIIDAARLGCSIRMSYADATVQDFMLVGSNDAVGGFVRWLFSLPVDSELSDADLLDALGETLNQVAGRVKELILADGEGEPLLGVPSFARRQNVVLASQRTDSVRHSLVSESWRGAVVVSITARQPLPLHLLAECGQTLHHLEGNDCFIRIQSLISELKESQRCAPPSIMNVLSACDEMAVAAVQSDCQPDYAARQLTARFLSLGPLIVGRLEALHGDFELPPAAEDIELLWEYVEDSNGQIESARGALSSPDQEALVVVFRALHTLKGNSGFFGLHQIQQLAHTTEDFVAQLQSGIHECDHVASQLVCTSLDS
ncbi:MAG: Hpt domain-containing protein [Nannocystaceae bacterium]|nr:Hpt domain-containing protein [Nannocystaceae bacterium]